ncbi:hypothetical protein ACFFX0_20470 [Citricoccus parietis]|uniref:Uncharacterized protein n=1 Tax=Citricoccus parietis TaxID=592307 RepID=A0ABV5G3C6_9MICC
MRRRSPWTSSSWLPQRRASRRNWFTAVGRSLYMREGRPWTVPSTTSRPQTIAVDSVVVATNVSTP